MAVLYMYTVTIIMLYIILNPPIQPQKTLIIATVIIHIQFTESFCSDMVW